MTIDERLEQGTVVIMDGGTGTELQRRGVAMDADAWCGLAHLTHPDEVRRVHEDYIRAGAEIVIANTFATARHVLEGAGHADRFDAANRRAVELAVAARETAAVGSVWIAGSISSMEPLRAAPTPAADLEADFARQAEILAEAGVDLIVLEMMQDAGAVPVVRAAAAPGLPVWVGFSASTDDGRIVGYRDDPDAAPIDFGRLADDVLAVGGDVAGVMHSDVAVTGPALEVLAARWQGTTMAYAETGWFAPPDWVFQEISPADYAAAAAAWVRDHGVQIVGGCCGTGPEHIRELRDRLAGTAVPTSGR